jgi:aminoglycoside phosphotransferase family enzyme/predicted kinase
VTLPELINALSDPRAYPGPVAGVTVVQTHISAVFLAGEFAYKVKKPVSLGFLDFGTLAKRRHFCDQEVALNRRLAPDVYLGVVPVTRGPAGLSLGGGGEVVEWAVKMRRLPDAATLLARLGRGEATPAGIEALARRVAEFHGRAEGGPRVAAYGRFAVVAGNARENFTQAGPWVGRTVSRPTFDRLRALTESWLDRLRPLIDRRAAAGVPRDTHGDLRLDHVYLFPDRPPPADIEVIDCVEFSDRFRFADPVADAAFLAADLGVRGYKGLAGAFADAYFHAAGDAGGRPLLPFYAAYRAAVRGKVEGFRCDEAEVPAGERADALSRAKAHWLYALGELEVAGRRPCLVLVGGLPGSGKSTLAAGLAARAGFDIVRSDEVRKGLAGVPPGAASPAGYGAGIYTPELTTRTYAECLRLAEGRLFDGRRVAVDATFGGEGGRRDFLGTAARLGVPGVFLHCQAPPGVTRGRLERRRNDASDADWSVHRRAAEQWQQPAGLTLGATRHISTADGTAEDVTGRALEVLRLLGLQG